MSTFRSLLASAALLWAGLVHAADPIAYLINAGQPPAGVVFEVAESDDDALDWAIPRISEYVARLRAKYPDLDMAVVTHGKEQFALQARNRADHEAAHSGVQSLLGEQVQVHVCGTHAGWYGVTEEDFPAYVDVAPAGPSQIRDYERLGWELVRVESD